MKYAVSKVYKKERKCPKKRGWRINEAGGLKH